MNDGEEKDEKDWDGSAQSRTQLRECQSHGAERSSKEDLHHHSPIVPVPEVKCQQGMKGSRLLATQTLQMMTLRYDFDGGSFAPGSRRTGLTRTPSAAVTMSLAYISSGIPGKTFLALEALGCKPAMVFSQMVSPLDPQLKEPTNIKKLKQLLDYELLSFVVELVNWRPATIPTIQPIAQSVGTIRSASSDLLLSFLLISSSANYCSREHRGPIGFCISTLTFSCGSLLGGAIKNEPESSVQLGFNGLALCQIFLWIFPEDSLLLFIVCKVSTVLAG